MSTKDESPDEERQHGGVETRRQRRASGSGNRAGVVEIHTSYTEALGLAGTSNAEGETIVVAYVKSPLILKWWLPFLIQLSGLVALAFLLRVQRPLYLLPDWLFLVPQAAAIRDYELFSTATFVLVLLVYVAFCVLSHIKRRRFIGQIGLDIHFTRFGKIVDSLTAGTIRFMFDPRIRPYAAVSTRSFVLDMRAVVGNTKDNISLTFRGSLKMVVRDSKRLLQQGGFENFLKQIYDQYEAAIRDQILGASAATFNRFMIEPAAQQQGAANLPDITKQLATLDAEHLSVPLLVKVSDIGELNVAEIVITDVNAGSRNQVIHRLNGIAALYGIAIEDHLPLGNMVPEDYLETLVIGLLSSIKRLQQATGVLMGTKKSEIEEDIQGAVAKVHLVLLQINRIKNGIDTTLATLQEPAQVDSLKQAKVVALQNRVQSLTAPVLARIDSLIARIRSTAIATTGADRYVTEYTRLVERLETAGADIVPPLGQFVTSALSEGTVLPDVDVVQLVQDRSGMAALLEQLKTGSTGDAVDLERAVGAIEMDVDKVADEVRDCLEAIRSELAQVIGTTGVDVSQYDPDRVAAEIDEIIRMAGIRTEEDRRAALSEDVARV